MKIIKITNTLLVGIYIALSASFALADGVNRTNTDTNTNTNTDTNTNTNTDTGTNAGDRTAPPTYGDRTTSPTTRDQQINGMKDNEITQRIRQELLDDSSLADNVNSIRVSTRSGKVVLDGLVNTLQEKNAAEQIATNLVGVENVENQITVRGN